jgi:D-alanyl-D-alanine carboxypeptidase (penicillin-binding protein 5/6)
MMRGRGKAGFVVFALLAAGAGYAGPAAAAPRVKQASRPTTTTLPAAPPANVQVPNATSYVLVDAGTGKVLAGYNERQPVPPASLTKILTALIAVTYLPANAEVRGTKASWNAYPNTVGIEIGVAWPLNEVLQSLLVLSANDAAYAIAQRVSGSLAAFAGVMERSADQIGMEDSPVFRDPAGLDGTEGYDGGNLVSARDLAIAGRDLLRVPELAKIVTEQQYHFVDPTGAAHWLPSMDEAFLESYTGAIGIKTGYTDKAGDCLMAAATRDGRTMLAVVMNGYNPTATAIDLLNEGFATPVNKERAADHLPPPALPSPPKVVAPRVREGTRAPRAGTRAPRAGTRAPRAGTRAPRAGARAPRAATIPAHGVARHTTATRPASLRPTMRLRGSTAPAAAVAHVPGRRGLGAVTSTWLGRALLIATGVSAVWALLELVTESNLRRRRRRATESFTSTGSVLTNLHGGKRRREQLLASYRRHERTSSRYGK